GEDLLDLGRVPTAASREHVDLEALPGETLGHGADVHVHAPGVAGSRLIQGRGVKAEHGNPGPGAAPTLVSTAHHLDVTRPSAEHVPGCNEPAPKGGLEAGGRAWLGSADLLCCGDGRLGGRLRGLADGLHRALDLPLRGTGLLGRTLRRGLAADPREERLATI